jgi:hypothetical protein
MLAVMLGVVLLATLVYGCGRTGSPANKQGEREGTRQAKTTTPEPTASTHSSSGTLLNRETGAQIASTKLARFP